LPRNHKCQRTSTILATDLKHAFFKNEASNYWFWMKKYLFLADFKNISTETMRKLFFGFSIAVLLGAAALTGCKKSSNGTPRDVKDDEKTLVVKLSNVPGEGRNVWLFTLVEGAFETGDKGRAFNDSIVKVAVPDDETKYTLLIYVADDKSWDPSMPLASGYYASYEVDKNPLAAFVAKNWEYLELYAGETESGHDGGAFIDISMAAPLVPIVTASIGSLNSNYGNGDIVNITASASDNDGGYVTSLEFYINGTKVDTQKEAPFYYNFNTIGKNPGKYLVKVIAANQDGYQFADYSDFIIDFESGGKAPEVSFAAPAHDATVYIGVQTQVTVSVTDDGKITNVLFFENANRLGQSIDDKTLYTFDWTPGGVPGKTTISVEVTDDDGNTRRVERNVKLEMKPKEETVPVETVPADEIVAE
jgi:hypothetical protein